ncbi:MAG: SBBP repeat-containing protein [Bacteroidetes bacterium]|nr:SBBP repeat-containing protein [Bacteroidota bacterium]
MKKNFTYLSFFLTGLSLFAAKTENETELKKQAQQWLHNQPVKFLENKGQMTDINGKSIPFVLFKAEAPNIDLYVTEKGLTFMLFEKEEAEGERETNRAASDLLTLNTNRVRVDMDLKGGIIKSEKIIKDGASAYFKQFYSGNVYGGVTVREYDKIIIQDVYPGVDWVLYNTNESGFKYDFVVHPGADRNQIRLLYRSKNKLEIDEQGNIKIETPLGLLTEKNPVSYVKETGKIIATRFNKTKVNRCSPNNTDEGFETEISYQIDPGCINMQHQTLIIDPQLSWATFYGSNQNEGAIDISADVNGNIYVAAYTLSPGLTLLDQGGGAYFQNVGPVGYNYHGLILKFSNNGVMQWATYYGGSCHTELYGIAFDATGNVFVVGWTCAGDLNTLGRMVNPGGGAYFQPGIRGYDPLILKFNSGGTLIWSTSYGDTNVNALGWEKATSVAVDNSGNVYVVGGADGPNLNLLNAGTYFQGSGGGRDAFIVKFSNAGVLLWGTYYGGTGGDLASSVAVDNMGNIVVIGRTSSTDLNVLGRLVNPGGGAYFQNTNAGLDDAFILKFSNSGVLLWATYYGGNNNEVSAFGINFSISFSLAIDRAGNIFASGGTTSTNLNALGRLVNPGGGTYFQNTNAGQSDAFILKFNNSGVLLWATYYGGTGIESMLANQYSGSTNSNIAIDNCNRVYVTFETSSTNIPVKSLSCSYSASYKGGFNMSSGNTSPFMSYDIFITRFSNSGVLDWTTHFGGNGSDFRCPLATDNNGNLFIAGEWSSVGHESDATSGGVVNNATYPTTNPGGGAYFDNSHNGDDDVYIAKFIPEKPAYIQSQVNVTGCGCNGSATVVVNCAIPNYSYAWSNGSSTINASTNSNTVTGLCPGNYWTEVKDASCIINRDTVYYTITGAGSVLTLVTTPTSNTCSFSNGTATVGTTGGTAPYTYIWSNGQTTSTSSGLGAGSYTVTVTDNGGCGGSQSVTIVPSGGITLTTTASNTLCYGSMTGTASANPSGGTTPYTFLWSNSQTTSVANNIGAGTYTVTVTDKNGCTAKQTVTITQPLQLVAGFTTQWSCGNNSGTATVYPTNGTPSYSYLWSNGQASATANGLNINPYTVTVTDANGCSVTGTVTPVFPLSLTGSSTNITCTTSGSASVTVNGNAGVPYTYNWSNGFTTQNASGLATGNYTVTVADVNGCTATRSYSITGTSPVSAAFTNSPACLGAAVTFTNIGSIGTYSWVISPLTPANVSGTTANFSYTFLTAGVYSVTHTVTNAGCSSTITLNITITNCNGPTVTATGSSVCPGSCAAITSSSTGGTGPYTYLWNNGATTQNINPCPVTTTIYTITVTDSGGNTSSSTAVVTVNPAVTVTITPTNITCNGGTNGSSFANPGGGTSPFAYNWSNGLGSGFQVSGLSAGNYTVTVTDSKGCSAISIATILSPPPLAGQFTKGTASCSGCGCKEWIMVNAAGGTNPYSYTWPDGYANRYKNQLCPGIYSINVKDKNGCSVNISLTAP